MVRLGLGSVNILLGPVRAEMTSMMNRPRLCIVFGIPFSGKSTIVRELFRQRGCKAIDIDAINTARGVGIAGAMIAPEDWAISFATATAQLDAATSTICPCANARLFTAFVCPA